MSSTKDERYAQIIGEIEQLMLDCNVLDDHGRDELTSLARAKQTLESATIPLSVRQTINVDPVSYDVVDEYKKGD